MNEIVNKIRNNTKLRITIGLCFIILGLLIHLIPLIPGSWVIVIGLEILGIRLLVQNKIKEWVKNSKLVKSLWSEPLQKK